MSGVAADFFCNLKSCRRPLENTAWITCCSHAFCEEDGQREFRQDGGEIKCPLCGTLLHKKYDMVHVNLDPTEEYKSMVLVGLRPETVMDIAGRAVCFWAYQLSSERAFQERLARQATARVEHVQAAAEAAMAAVKAELSTTRRKAEALEKENEALRMRLQGLQDTLTERGRQVQKLNGALSMLRRSAVDKSSGLPNEEVISPSKTPSTGRSCSSNASSVNDAFSMEQDAVQAAIAARERTIAASQKASDVKHKIFRIFGATAAGWTHTRTQPLLHAALES